MPVLVLPFPLRKKNGQDRVGDQARSQRAVEQQSGDAAGAFLPQEESAEGNACQDGKDELEGMGHGDQSSFMVWCDLLIS